jgi:hypothetical protein
MGEWAQISLGASVGIIIGAHHAAIMPLKSLLAAL